MMAQVRQFQPGWPMTMVVAVLLPCIVSLGFWQLDRGATKRGLEMAYLDKLTTLPVRPADDDLVENFQRVVLKGQFMRQVFLVDNQVSGGVTGYWVVQTFADELGANFLVNRGFTPGTSSRKVLPTIDTPAGKVNVIGAVWPDTGLIPVLDEDKWEEGWPKRVQRLDIGRMSAYVSAKKVEIRLEPGQPGVAIAAPFASLLSDAKHLGYAATWFGLAAALCVSFIVFGFKHSPRTET